MGPHRPVLPHAHRPPHLLVIRRLDRIHDTTIRFSQLHNWSALFALPPPKVVSDYDFTDRYANIPPIVSDPGFYARLARGETNQAVDIPIDVVNRILYPPRKRRRPEDDAKPP